MEPSRRDGSADGLACVLHNEVGIRFMGRD
jgi:hypothetical protein